MILYNSSDTSFSPSSGLFIIPAFFSPSLWLQYIPLARLSFRISLILLGFCCSQPSFSFSLVQLDLSNLQPHKIIHIRATILFTVHSLGPQNFCAEWSVIVQVHWSPQERNSDLLSHVSLDRKKTTYK